ncbi:hypothetical protein V8C34DRAFT_285253, partial [Trichoderma compactum]
MTSITSQRRTAGFDGHGVQLVIRSSGPEWHICPGAGFLFAVSVPTTLARGMIQGWMAVKERRPIAIYPHVEAGVE